jgi:hypothetical protein
MNFPGGEGDYQRSPRLRVMQKNARNFSSKRNVSRLDEWN